MQFIKPSFTIMHCPDGEEVLRLLEEAARTCYKSEDKIDPGQRCACFHTPAEERRCSSCTNTWQREPSSYALVRKILDSGHHSVIEHCSITVRFICNRGVTHELVRHRLASYSQESTRYCNYSKDKHGGELNIIEPSHRPRVTVDASVDSPKGRERRRIWEHALDVIESTYLSLIELGEQPQGARDILPIGLKTEIVCTANLREWRHIFALRCSKRAHPQIRELMVPLREKLQRRIPLIFDEVKPHKYDVLHLKALMRDGAVTKRDLQAALDEV